MVLIAHSLAEVTMCDDVWVMAEGAIVESGTPEELLKRDRGVFAHMHEVGAQPARRGGAGEAAGTAT